MTSKVKKERLDNILVTLGHYETKSQAQGAILAGKVKVNTEIITKAGFQLKQDENLNIEIESMPFVSRGGFKLNKALKEFNINVKDKICLDAGASTGGFTDCLLQNDAKKVYAVDVGYGQIAWKLRNSPNVVVIERTNIRNTTADLIYTDLEDLDSNKFAQIVTMDLSFISITKVLENIKNFINPTQCDIIALIKPQFEAGKEQVPKSGVVKDRQVHLNVIKQVIDFACQISLFPVDLTYSPIQGPAGNIEYLVHLSNVSADFNKEIIESVVSKAYEQFTPDKIN